MTTLNSSQVSVIIPTYNEEECIADLLQSLADYERIVVDDGTDRTMEIASKLGAKVLKGRGDEAPSIALGLENAREYSVIMDADGSHKMNYRLGFRPQKVDSYNGALTVTMVQGRVVYESNKYIY
jgi:glycosyltransferase involved in cell wall biosynthesis